jgi:hypothetical protein
MRISVITLASLLLCNFCLTVPSANAQSSPSPPDANCGCVITSLQGTSSVKFKGTTGTVPATVRMFVHLGDLISVGPSSQAELICDGANGNRILTTGPHGVPCTTVAGTPIVIGGPDKDHRLLDSTTLGDGSELDVPIVLSPRASRILSIQPELRWRCLQGATEYHLTVRGGSLSWAGVAHSTSFLKYPADAPALAPGTPYKLVVAALGRSSEEEAQPGLGFTVVSLQEQQEINDALTTILNLQLEPKSKALLRARFLANHDLISEAIQGLEEASHDCDEPTPRSTWSNDADFLQLLGTLYARIGLSSFAEKYLLHSLELSNASGDRRGEAISSGILGQIYLVLGNKTNAINRLNEAKSAYAQIGDKDNVEQMQRELQRLTAH